MSTMGPKDKIVYLEKGQLNSLDKNAEQYCAQELKGSAALTGIKHDLGKPRMSLVPPEALEEIAKVLTFGAAKYNADNWRGGFEYRRVSDAALRHINAWVKGENLDPETKLSHLAHAICGLMFLITFQKTNTGVDDRFKYEQKD